jgi:hypothetical protein
MRDAGKGHGATAPPPASRIRRMGLRCPGLAADVPSARVRDRAGDCVGMLAMDERAWQSHVALVRTESEALRQQAGEIAEVIVRKRAESRAQRERLRRQLAATRLRPSRSRPSGDRALS